MAMRDKGGMAGYSAAVPKKKKNKKTTSKETQNQKQTIAQVECTAQGEQFLHHREQNIPVVPKKNQT
jgi:ribosomal protein L32